MKTTEPARYEIERKLVDEAFERATWRVGNRFATPVDAFGRGRQEIERTLRGTHEDVMTKMTKADYWRAIQLTESIEEAMAELVCLLSPADGTQG